MNFKETLYVSSQIGELALQFEKQALTSLTIRDDHTKSHNKSSKTQLQELQTLENNEYFTLVKLKDYFSRSISLKNIVLLPEGTAFQKSVWQELIKIPLGETRTYGQIAKILGSSARAVGNACRKNPILIAIPCHRVVSASGIGGFTGQIEGKQIGIKRWLLQHEGAQF